MTDKTGGPAFPAQHSIDGNWVKEPLAEYTGMTLRDYFAAKAMHAYLVTIPDNRPDMEIFAKSAYEMADAMLKARMK